MASIRTKPYHLYLVSLKFPGSSRENASWTSGNPANGLASLVFAAAGAPASLAAGVVDGDGRVNAGGFDDIPVSAGTWVLVTGVDTTVPAPGTRARNPSDAGFGKSTGGRTAAAGGGDSTGGKAAGPGVGN